MNADFQRWMAEATQHTRAGRLDAAQQAIRRAMGGGSSVPTADPAAFDDVIDVEARVLPDLPGLGSMFGFDDLRGFSPRPAKAPAAAPEAPVQARGEPQAPGTFKAARFSLGHQQCDYHLYVPPGPVTAPRPLVVMLHGCTQNPVDFASGTDMNARAAALGVCVLYPAQSQKGNAQKCWNWFKHNHQARERGEPALLAALTRHVMATESIDPQRVYVAGLSAGGAMAAILGETHPDLFAAVGVHSGLAAGAARDLPGALAAMKGGGQARPQAASGLPTIVFHGDADPTVHPSNGAQVVAASVGAAPVRSAVSDRQPGGRRWTREELKAVDGRVIAEHWTVHGAGHAWSGGTSRGSYTDPTGPDASAEMLRFFLAHPRLH